MLRGWSTTALVGSISPVRSSNGMVHQNTICVLCGAKMMAIEINEGPGFRLSYLGFKRTGFATMDAAKAGAPALARRALEELSDRVTE